MNPRNQDTEWQPRKSLGQNFLQDEAVARKIVSLAAIDPRETILEVGPGKGALTRIIAERSSRVVAVEIDPTLAANMRKWSAKNVEIVERDILRVDLAELGREHGVERWPIIGNLPYVISSRLAMRLVEQARAIDRATLMVQREVGERYLAPPGSRTYGLLSVLLQATGTLESGFRVSATSFKPKPSVESIVLTWKSDPPEDLNIGPLIITAKVAFAQRRKQLGNALRGLPAAGEALVAEACRSANIDPTRRAESLSSDEFIALSRTFLELGAFDVERG